MKFRILDDTGDAQATDSNLAPLMTKAQKFSREDKSSVYRVVQIDHTGKIAQTLARFKGGKLLS